MKTATNRKQSPARKSSKKAVVTKARRPLKSKRPSRYHALLATTASSEKPLIVTEAVTHQLLEDATPPDDWSKLTRGSLCLALENIGDGWFEAVVQKIDGDRVTLMWRDYPGLPTFTRTAQQLAFRHPKMAKPC